MTIRPADGLKATPAVTPAKGVAPAVVAPVKQEGDAPASLHYAHRLVRTSAQDRPLTPADRQLLDELTRANLHYFTDHTNAKTGLTADSSAPGSPASIAACGFSLTAYGVAVHRGLMSRESAAAYELKALRTLASAPQGSAGVHGFFYHFLNPATARRAGTSEVSTVDTALLMGGVLFARNFFDGDSPDEQEIRKLATKLYNDVDWNWARAGGDTLSLGWTPEPQKPQPFPFNVLFAARDLVMGKPKDPGFIPFRWSGYSEGSLMVLLGMGSPTHPLPAKSWEAYHRLDGRAAVKGQGYVPFGPMFGHQYSHAWIDFRGIHDAASDRRGYDWAENSRRATLAQHAYAVKNPKGLKGYGALDWGITASEGPGKTTKVMDGKTREFQGYLARGAPQGPDDGTLAPTAVAASLPFAPELVLPTLHHWRDARPELWTSEGFADAFNPTFDAGKPSGWVAPDRLGIDQGPIVLMTENFRSGFVWDVMKRDPDLRRGLQRAGFRGGWLDRPAT